MNESKVNEEIKVRFYNEVYRLVKEKKTSINSFLIEHEIDSRNFYKTRKSGNLRVPASWIYFLCKDFSISTDKIIIGDYRNSAKSMQTKINNIINE